MQLSRATVEVMGHHIISNISKKTSNLILHVETNDAKNSAFQEILDNILKIKSFFKREFTKL